MSSELELTEYQQGLLEIIQNRTPATPQEIANTLRLLSAEMERARLLLAEARKLADKAIEDHDREFDKAFLVETMTDPRVGYVPVARAKARDATWELRLVMREAKTEVKRLEKLIDVLNDRIWTGKSIAKTLRSEMENLGGGRWGA